MRRRCQKAVDHRVHGDDERKAHKGVVKGDDEGLEPEADRRAVRIGKRATCRISRGLSRFDRSLAKSYLSVLHQLPQIAARNDRSDMVQRTIGSASQTESSEENLNKSS